MPNNRGTSLCISSTNVGLIYFDGKRTRWAVLATRDSVTGSGAMVGTISGQYSDEEPTGSSRGERSIDGRPVQTPTRVTLDDVAIDFESCQVCHVTGDASKRMYTDADFEYYVPERGSTSHLRQSFWGELPLTIDATELVGRLPASAENPLVGQVWDENVLPLTNLVQPAQWECRNER